MISLRMVKELLPIISHFHSLNCTAETAVQNSKGRQVGGKKLEFSYALIPLCIDEPAFIIKP